MRITHTIPNLIDISNYSSVKNMRQRLHYMYFILHYIDLCFVGTVIKTTWGGLVLDI